MNIALFSYFFYAIQLILLQSTKSYSRTILAHSKERNKKHEIMQRNIYHCFDDISGSIVAIGNWMNDDVLLSKTILSDSKPVYLFDAMNNIFRNYKKIDKINQSIDDIKVYPSSNVTIVVSSKDTLKKILNNLKVSIWWNHEANFLIINDDQRIGCSLARQFLHIIWNFSILSAIYICFNNKSQVIMSTFNPYDRSGTDFWRVAWISDAADNCWTMFDHVFDESFYLNNISLNCNDLNLERTKNLNRLNINMGAHELIVPILPGSVEVEAANDLNIFRIILQKLNATYTFKNYSEFGYNNNGSDPKSYLKDLETGSLNVVTNLCLLRGIIKQHSYPYEFNSLCFVTPNNIDIQYFASFHMQDWFLIAAVSLVSIIIIKYVLNQSVSVTLLEFCRMLTGSAFLQKASQSRDNFFLINTIFAISTFSIFMQIRLTTYKTAPDKGQQIDSLDELMNTNMMLVGDQYSKEFVYNERCLQKFVVGNEIDCLNDIIAGEEKACVLYCSALMHRDYSNYIHEANERLTTRPSVFPFSANWPLHSKFDLIMSYMIESGIFRFESAGYRVTKWRLPKERRQVDQISMEELRLNFYLFFVVCSLAVLTFFIELSMNKIRKIPHVAQL